MTIESIGPDDEHRPMSRPKRWACVIVAAAVIAVIAFLAWGA